MSLVEMILRPTCGHWCIRSCRHQWRNCVFTICHSTEATLFNSFSQMVATAKLKLLVRYLNNSVVHLSLCW